MTKTVRIPYGTAGTSVILICLCFILLYHEWRISQVERINLKLFDLGRLHIRSKRQVTLHEKDIEHQKSQLPVGVLKNLCDSVRERCFLENSLRGDPGLPGAPGLKGKRGRPGRVGAKGSQGHIGPIGPPGPRGQKGDRGLSGPPGVNGRDGLAGDPGLDGIPGRNGIDGVPGQDGIPGVPGSPGVPGINGKRGSKGSIGPRGPQGPQGKRGLAGPRGRKGQDGRDGEPGEPGVHLWTVPNIAHTNGVLLNESGFILIPPDILGTTSEMQVVRVQEGSHLKLSCFATGIPEPSVVWSGVNDQPFTQGVWQKNCENGATLSIPRIHRAQAGKFVCEASNGIPPSDSQIFDVHVEFSPLVLVEEPLVGAFANASIKIECSFEAFPKASLVWERYDGEIHISHFPTQNRNKYRLLEHKVDTHTYRSVLMFEITEDVDFGTYYCRSTNRHGTATGVIQLYETILGSAVPPPILKGGAGPLKFGQRPPPLASSRDVCPPPIDCADCRDDLCHSNVRSDNISIIPYDSSFRSLPKRSQACFLSAIGKPVLLRMTTSDMLGSWMAESSGAAADGDDRMWETVPDRNDIIYQYTNKVFFSGKRPFKNITLPLDFHGNDHVIFNGTLYYYNDELESIVSYHLASGRSRSLQIPRNFENEAEEFLVAKLYKYQESFVDFGVDESGVWAVFGLLSNNHTVVMKLNESTLLPQYMWEISLNHRHVVDSFVLCGLLYIIEPGVDGHLNVRFAIDLYENKAITLGLPFTNPYGHVVMLNYNPRLQSLASWDAGRPLIYPIKYHSQKNPKYKTFITGAPDENPDSGQ